MFVSNSRLGDRSREDPREKVFQVHRALSVSVWIFYFVAVSSLIAVGILGMICDDPKLISEQKLNTVQLSQAACRTMCHDCLEVYGCLTCGGGIQPTNATSCSFENNAFCAQTCSSKCAQCYDCKPSFGFSLSSSQGFASSGYFSIGMATWGLFSISSSVGAGLFVVGLIVSGGFSFGVFATGMFATGLFAYGFYANGFIAVGNRANGVFAYGKYATGVFARGKHARGYFAKGSETTIIYPFPFAVDNSVNSVPQSPQGLEMSARFE